MWVLLPYCELDIINATGIPYYPRISMVYHYTTLPHHIIPYYPRISMVYHSATLPHHIIPTTAVKPNQGLVNNVFPNMNRLRYSDTYLGRYYHCQLGKINSTGLRLSLQGVPHFIRFQLCNLHQLLVKRCGSAASPSSEVV